MVDARVAALKRVAEEILNPIISEPYENWLGPYQGRWPEGISWSRSSIIWDTPVFYTHLKSLDWALSGSKVSFNFQQCDIYCCPPELWIPVNLDWFDLSGFAPSRYRFRKCKFYPKEDL